MQLIVGILQIFWIFISFVLFVNSKATLSLKIRNFQKLSYQRLDGKCCGGFNVSIQNTCPEKCLQKFKFCLENYQTKVSLNNPKPYNGPCALGTKDTLVSANLNELNIYSYKFDIQTSWTMYLILVIEAYDYTNKNVLNPVVIDRIAYKNILKPIPENESTQKWHKVTLWNEASVYEFSIKLVCLTNYYGVSCEKYCKNNLGHYKCDQTGNKICDNGWMGSDCSTAICKPGCHSVHGYCTEPGQCKCTEGWQGQYCDICIKYPGCMHGTCVDSPWTCYCLPNWGGYFCDKNLNYCTENNPCKNGGLCENKPEETKPYKCTCPSGYQGDNCEIDLCAPNPCKKGTCIKSKEKLYCQCFPSWKGELCDLELSSCDETSCRNGGECKKSPIGISKCLCKPGFRGSECQTSSTCDYSQCKHAQSCQIQSYNSEIYECICQPGWHGKFCDIEINECENNPCKNGAVCKDLVNDYVCQCKNGFIGKKCEVNVACQMKPCKNGGVCQETDLGHVCKCKKEYSGFNCEIYKTGCTPNPCRNGAYCFTMEQDFYCQCNSKYWGKYCEHQRPYCGRESCSLAYDACSMPFRNSSDFNHNVCGKYGTCVSKEKKDFECKCISGFEGKYCEKNINDCEYNLCENGGVCIDGINNFECICENGFKGNRCEERIDYCAKNPCINGGHCKEINDFNDFACTCHPYGGRLCNQIQSACNDNPCLHNGNCSIEPYGTNTFKCLCQSGWMGSLCQFKESHLKPCNKINNVCQNGGICINFGDDDFTCHCPEGYEGKYCEKNINECHPNPCFNDGTCVDLINSFKCECLKGFYGTHCQLNYDECISNPCTYGAVCIDRIDGFECRCPEGRIGNLCDRVSSNQTPQPPSCIYHNRTFDSGQHWAYNCQNCRCDTGKITCTKDKCGVWSCLKANGTDDPYSCKSDEECQKFPFDPSRCFVPPCVQKAKCYKKYVEIPSMTISWPGENNKHCRPNAIQKNNYCAQILLLFRKSNMPVGVTVDDICDFLKVLPVVKVYKDTVQGDSLSISCEVSVSNSSTINVAIYSPNDNRLLLKSINTLRPFVHYLSDVMADNLYEIVKNNYSILSGLTEIKVDTLLLHSDVSDQSDMVKYLMIPVVLFGIIMIILIIWHHRKKMNEFRNNNTSKSNFNNNNCQFQTVPQHPIIRPIVQNSGLPSKKSHYSAFPNDQLHSQNIPSMWSHGHHA